MQPDTNEPYVRSRKVGNAVVSVISDGSIRVPIEWVLDMSEIERGQAAPGDADGKERFDHLSYHVRLGDASVLIDAGLDDPSVAPSRANPFQAGLVRSPGIPAGLASIGVLPEEVTHVVVTHLHWDHFMGVAAERDGSYIPRYPNARYFVHRRDWDALPRLTDSDPDLLARLRAVEEAGLLELVDSDREIVPGLDMLHAPGESPGHCVARLITDGEAFYALGDLVHHGCEVEQPGWTRNADHHAELRASRQRFFQEVATRGAAASFSHAVFPGWGRIIATGTGYRWAEVD